MKKKTKIILLVVAIFIIVGVVLLAVMFRADFKQEEKLGKEMNSLYTLLNTYPFDYEALDKQLSVTITTDDYAKVEKAIKDYTGDFIKYMKQFDTLVSDETLANALNIENIKADGPDFTNTKQKLTESRTSLDTIYNGFSNYFSEEVAMSYVKDIGLDEYYTDLYKQYALGDNLAEMEAARDELLNNLDKIKALIENEEKGINLLVDNKDGWKVENDQLLFYSNSLIQQYNDIVAEINQAE